MGFEYKLFFEGDTGQGMDEALRSLTGFSMYDEGTLSYEFRSPKNRGRLPNASIVIKPNSIYLCDFGGPKDFIDALQSGLRPQPGNFRIIEIDYRNRNRQ